MMPIDSNIPMGLNYPQADMAGSYNKGFELRRKIDNAPLERQQLETETKAKQIEAAGQKINAIGGLLSKVKDQDSYTQARRIAIGQGLATPEEVPEMYDPNTVAAWTSALNDGADAIKQAQLELMQAGGVQGALVDRANNDSKFRQGLIDMKLMSKGLEGGPDGLQPMPGYNEAVGGTKFQESKSAAEGKIAGETQGEKGKKAAGADNTIMLIEEAEKLLPSASNGLFGAGATSASKAIGKSTDASKADAKLKVLSAALVAGVPRMEGPQSNYDVALYKQAAADVANPLMPAEDRTAALGTMKALQQKYKGAIAEENIPTGGSISTPEAPKKGQRKGGYVFLGGDPSNPKSWKKER